MLLRCFVLVLFTAIYFTAFSTLDDTFQNRVSQLRWALSAKVQQVTFGYLSQLASELLFIKTSVFIGGVKPGVSAITYVEPLANNFEVMTSLYPEFIDPYYFTMSYLAPISKEGAHVANAVIGTGITVYPNNHIFRFFHAFNSYNYLDQPLKAAETFKEAAKLPNAPAMFEHLAVVFSAKGGNISAGLVMLKIMLASEKEEKVRERYQQEIEIFEKALIIDKAIVAYSQKHHTPPRELKELVPEYFDKLPEIKDHFILVYEPPALPSESAVLSLKRPDR